MQVKNEVIFYAGQVIQGRLGEIKFPLEISFKIAKFTKKLNEATKPLEKRGS